MLLLVAQACIDVAQAAQLNNQTAQARNQDNSQPTEVDK